MINSLTEIELEQFNYLIKVIYLGVMNGRSKIPPYPNAIDTIKDKVGIKSFCNIMEVLEKDCYTMPCPNGIPDTPVLTKKGIKYAKNKLNLN